MNKHIVIIGNGIAGITAARHIRKLSDHRITVISSESTHFYSRTALMYIYMGHMKYEHTKPYEDWFWEKNRIDLVFNHVENVDTTIKALNLSDHTTIAYDVLILATGSRPNVFNWPGQDLQGVQGLYSLQDLEQMEKNSRNVTRAVIVGGGLIGVEMAEMLQSRNISVTFLVRETNFWDIVLPRQEASLLNRHIRAHGIDLRLETELQEIKGDESGHVQEVITSNGEKISCQFVGLTVGVHPNISFLEGSGVDTAKGVLVDEYLRTNLPDVYAIGDCVQHKSPPQGRRPMEQVWYTGRIMGETVAKTICGQETKYAPGHWFNAAKFFDIEYQTYGMVSNMLLSDEDEYYWEYDGGDKCMHFVFNKKDKRLIGINTFGIRLRHEVFDQWLTDGRNIGHVLKNLKDAHFDPEFHLRHETEIIEGFNRKFPTDSVGSVAKKSWLNKIIG